MWLHCITLREVSLGCCYAYESLSNSWVKGWRCNLVPPPCNDTIRQCWRPKEGSHMIHSKQQTFPDRNSKTLEEQTAKEDIIFSYFSMFHLIHLSECITSPLHPMRVATWPWKADPPNFPRDFHGFQTSARQSCRGISPNHNLHPRKNEFVLSKYAFFIKSFLRQYQDEQLLKQNWYRGRCAILKSIYEDWGQGSAVISVDIWEFKSCSCWWLVVCFLICASPPGRFKTRVSTLYFYSQSCKNGVKDCESIISLGNCQKNPSPSERLWHLKHQSWPALQCKDPLGHSPNNKLST